MRVVQSTGAREVAKGVLMAENVRSPFDYREPPTLDSDGDGSKPPPPRGRVCGRKRKGTPVKVCDRAYVTEDEEEESMSEHSYSPGDGQYPEGAEDRLPRLAVPITCLIPLSSELGEEGASGVRGPVLFHPPPNCRIREVHCGTQVRLVVIAIRDIAKGEEITVDYSLTDWGENAMPSDSDREEDEEEEDDDDDDDDEEEEIEEIRGRMLRRRKKRKMPAAVNSKKKSAPPSSRGPGRPCSSFSRPAPVTPPVRSQSQPPVSALAPPTTNINNNININIGSSSGATVSRRQHCPYCGRHYRSLARHLEKHHANQPEVRTAMELAHLHTHNSSNGSASHPQPSSSSSSSAPATHSHSFAVPQPSAPNPAPPSLFSREREPPATRSSTGAVSFSLSLSPPSSAQSAAAKKGSSLPAPPAAKRPAPPTVTRVKSPSPPPPPSTPRRGRRMKREKQEEQQKVEVESSRSQEELVPPPTPEPDVDPEEDLELSGEGEEDPPEEKNGEIVSTHRHHMSPLLSSLSCLVLYLRHQQHSSFLSLTRSPHSAEAWRLLCHSSLSLLILYNRHRECEVAKLTIQDYRNRVTPQSNSSTSSPSGMEAVLSPFERQPNVGVDPESPYVFSRPYHSPATPLRGTDLLRNLARTSGAKNPGALTATRVRRQVAILTQLLLLEEGEGQSGATKRLEDFLEREYHVTQNCSSIIRDPALMGRVGRVVLYGEREGVLFRGMSLQHICLELDVMSGNSADSFSEDSEAEEEKEEVKEKAEVMVKKKGPGRPPRKKRAPIPSPVSPPSIPNVHKRRCIPPKSGKRGVLKRPWSEAERVAVETHLKRNLMELRVPAKADCERCLELCPLLVSNQRDWRAIKFYVHNRIQLLKKQGRRESAAAIGDGGVESVRRPK
ncbi:hypothetical protein INR49_011822, partial [Caranx melampygus]